MGSDPGSRQCFGSVFIWYGFGSQHFRLNTDPDPGFWWPKIDKNFQLKKNLPFPVSLGLHKGSKGSPSYRRSLQFLKENNPALQNVKFLNFFLFLLVTFALLDPIRIPNLDTDPLTWSGQSGSETVDPGSSYRSLKNNMKLSFKSLNVLHFGFKKALT